MNQAQKDRAESLLEKSYRETVRKDPGIVDAFMLVHSDKLGIHVNVAEGTTGGMPVCPYQPYYVASVGKLFTSVVIALLAERGLLSYEDRIVQYLDEDVIRGLHVYRGKDYSNDIRVKHLLNHTSGLHDYFEDKPRSGKAMIELLLDEPSRFWTPRETIFWSKENLKSHFPPGKGFHYSDTGYHLLGLIIETITSKQFHEVLGAEIFQPLGMSHSYLAQHSRPLITSTYPIASVYVGNINVADYRSLSIDYAGGGIVSTSDDLLMFMQSLVHNRIIGKDTFESMKDWARFLPGIDYGYGLMNFKTVPVIMPKKYNVWGNAGSVGSFMFYHPEMDLYLIGTLNRFRYHRKGIRVMFKAVDIVRKYAGNE